jgi:hypothetical protein
MANNCCRLDQFCCHFCLFRECVSLYNVCYRGTDTFTENLTKNQTQETKVTTLKRSGNISTIRKCRLKLEQLGSNGKVVENLIVCYVRTKCIRLMS